MGKNSAVTVGFKYRLGLLLGLCHGPVDALEEIRSDERTAWTGSQTVSGQISINAPDLYGGDKKEGGLVGALDVQMGEALQTKNDYLVSTLGAVQPAYRGLLTLVYRRGQVGSNNPYVKPWQFKVRRNSAGWYGDNPWYAAKAQIGIGQNPAHIVYECLTNPDWGMGYPTSAIDNTVFTDVADYLYDEGFGLCLQWVQSTSIEDFVQSVMDHIGGVLYLDPATGLFGIKLIRADYNPATLPVFDPSNLIAVEQFERQAWGDTTNEVTITWIDQADNAERVVTVHDLANIQAQGRTVTKQVAYPGICSFDIAARVAQRDLDALCIPLARVRMRANRQAWSLFPGSVIKLDWPEHGISGLVLRVLSVDTGTLTDAEITIDAAEDVFALPANNSVGNQGPQWHTYIVAPEPFPSGYTMLTELPYYELARNISEADLATIDVTDTFIAAAARRPTNETLDYDIAIDTTGGGFDIEANGDFAAVATIDASIPQGKDDYAVPFTPLDEREAGKITSGLWVMIDDECMGIVDVTGNTITLSRGVLDTVPTKHSSGAKMWVLTAQYMAIGRTTLLPGESIPTKFLPRTGLGLLDFDDAVTSSIELRGRQGRPYPPGNLTINEQYYPDNVTGSLTISWAHRDRLQQLAGLVSQTEGSIGPEEGTTYRVQLFSNDNPPATIADFTTANESITIEIPEGANWIDGIGIKVCSRRGGLESWQCHEVNMSHDGNGLGSSSDATLGVFYLFAESDGRLLALAKRPDNSVAIYATDDGMTMYELAVVPDSAVRIQDIWGSAAGTGTDLYAYTAWYQNIVPPPSIGIWYWSYFNLAAQTFTYIPLGISAFPLCLYYDATNAQYVILATDKKIYTTTDFDTFTDIDLILPADPALWDWYAGMRWRMFEWGGFYYLFHSAGGAQYDTDGVQLMRSADLETWELCPGTGFYSPPAGITDWYNWQPASVAWDDTAIYIAGWGRDTSTMVTHDYILRSTDGETFTIAYSGTAGNTWRTGAADGAGLVLFSRDTGRIRSTDYGVTWTKTDIPGNADPDRIRPVGGIMIGSKFAEGCYYSSDAGLDWTECTVTDDGWGINWGNDWGGT